MVPVRMSSTPLLRLLRVCSCKAQSSPVDTAGRLCLVFSAAIAYVAVTAVPVGPSGHGSDEGNSFELGNPAAGSRFSCIGAMSVFECRYGLPATREHRQDLLSSTEVLPGEDNF